MTGALRIGTRSSALALAQSGQTVRMLGRHGIAARLVPLTTPGDLDTSPLAGRGHEGIFVSSVRDALLGGHIDVALHSFKDVPTEPVGSITVAAVPDRADPRDTLVSAHGTLTQLPQGSRVGTCSVRRAAWVRRMRPDLVVVPIRGNIDARIDRVRSGEFEAIILAAAGLIRLGRASDIAEVIAATSLVPAPAQGALALECRADDVTTTTLVQRMDHQPTHLAAIAERAVLDSIDPSDRTAIGALAVFRGSTLVLLSDLSEPDGSDRRVSRSVSLVRSPADAVAAGRSLAADLVSVPMSRAS